jgi:serine/threonine protein kinase
VLKLVPASWEYAIKEELLSLYQKILSEKPRNVINLKKGPSCSRSSIRLQLIPIGTLVRPQSLPELKAAIRGILHGLEWLHGNGFVHRDLRWNNVIIDSTGCVRIIDFEHSGKEGHVDFVLPIWPLLKNSRYTREIDLQLVGKMITGSDLYPGESEYGAVDFVVKLDSGATATDALQHSWLKCQD